MQQQHALTRTSIPLLLLLVLLSLLGASIAAPLAQGDSASASASADALERRMPGRRPQPPGPPREGLGGAGGRLWSPRPHGGA
ncbi:hypothetical protein OC844_003140 [Tilletia horrida]|nr:hypothetical protein OC844_003140 [Tilletia horrida]